MRHDQIDKYQSNYNNYNFLKMQNHLLKKKHPRFRSSLVWAAASLLNTLASAQGCLPPVTSIAYSGMIDVTTTTTQSGGNLLLSGPDNIYPSGFSFTDTCLELSYVIEESRDSAFQDYPKLTSPLGGVIAALTLDGLNPPSIILPDFSKYAVTAGTYVFVLSCADASTGLTTAPQVNLEITETVGELTDPCADASLNPIYPFQNAVFDYPFLGTLAQVDWAWSDVLASTSDFCDYSIEFYSSLDDSSGAGLPIDSALFTYSPGENFMQIQASELSLISHMLNLPQYMFYRVKVTNQLSEDIVYSSYTSSPDYFTVNVKPGDNCPVNVDTCQATSVYDYSVATQWRPAFSITATACTDTALTYTCTSDDSNSVDLCDTFVTTAPFDTSQGTLTLNNDSTAIPEGNYSVSTTATSVDGNSATCIQMIVAAQAAASCANANLSLATQVPFSDMSFNIGDADLITSTLLWSELVSSDNSAICNYAIEWQFSQNGIDVATPGFIGTNANYAALGISTTWSMGAGSLIANYRIYDADNTGVITPWTSDAFEIQITKNINDNCGQVLGITHYYSTYENVVYERSIADVVPHTVTDYKLWPSNCENPLIALSSKAMVNLGDPDYTPYIIVTYDDTLNIFTITIDTADLIGGGTLPSNPATVDVMITFTVTQGSYTEETFLTIRMINPCMNTPDQVFIVDKDQESSLDYAMGTGALVIPFPSFTIVEEFCGTILMDLQLYDPAWILSPAVADGTFTVLEVATDKSLVGTSTDVTFSLSLADYHHDVDSNDLVLDFVITINYVLCAVDSSDFVTPDLESVEMEVGVYGSSQLVDFTEFVSASADACRLPTSWVYSLSLSSTEADTSRLEVEDYVAFNSDFTQIEVYQIESKPPAQTLTVTVTGTLLTNNDPEEATVNFDVTYTSSEVLDNIPLPFTPAGFENPVDSSIVFDLADVADHLKFELGRITTFDDSEFNVRVRSPSSFIKFKQKKGSYWVIVDLDQAQAGNYDLTFTISMQVGQISQDVAIKIKVEIVDSRLADDSEEVESETTEEETTTSEEEESASAGGTAAATTQTSTSSTGTEDVYKTPVVTTEYSKKFEGFSVEKIEEHNEKIFEPSIVRISPMGGLELNFSKDRFIEAEGVDVNTKESRRRRLQNTYGEEDVDDQGDDELVVEKIYGEQSSGLAVKGIQLWVEPGEMTDKEMIKFSYSVDKFDATGMSINLEFKNPEYVSSTILKDQLVVSMQDFRDVEGNLIAEDQELRQSIPNQISPELGVAIASAGAAASSAVGASVSLNLFFNLAMKSSMNQMLGSIKNLQVIVHLCLIEVIVPSNAQIFISQLSEMIAFDPIDLSLYFGDTFEVYEEEIELPDNFVQLGYESAYFLSNMGSLTYIIGFQIVFFAMLIIFSACPCCCARVRKWSKSKINGCFLNGTLAFIDGTFLVVLLMAVINLKQELDGNVGQDISFWLSILVAVVCTLEIICVTYFFCKNYEQLGEEKHLKRCGYIYEDLNWKIRGWTALLYPIMYQLRFVILIAVVIYLNEYLVFQVLIIILSTILIMTNLGAAHPYAVVRRNYTSILSEFVIVLVMDLLLFSSDPSISLEARMMIGWAITGILGLSIAFSQGSLLIGIICQSITKCKLKYSRRQNMKRHKLMKRKGGTKEKKRVKFVAPSNDDDSLVYDDPPPAQRENQIDQEPGVQDQPEEIPDQGRIKMHKRQKYANGTHREDSRLSIVSQQSAMQLLVNNQTSPSKRARTYADEAVSVSVDDDDELLRVQRQNPGLATLKPAPIHALKSNKTRGDGLIGDLELSNMVSEGAEEEDCVICLNQGTQCILCELKQEKADKKIASQAVTAKNSMR